MPMESPLIKSSFKGSQHSKTDLDSFIEKSLPSWNATWNMLLQANQESCRGRKRSITRTPSELHKKIRKKIIELVDKEEALVDLYIKAAEAARDREMNLRSKSAILREQIEKDKNMMKILRCEN